MSAEQFTQSWRDTYFTTNEEEKQQQSKEMDAFVADLVRDATGKQPHDPEYIEALEQALKLADAEKAQLFDNVDKAARQVVEPVITKALELAGVDPNTADQDAIEAAFASLTPEQASYLEQMHEEGMKRVLEPFAREMLAEVGDMEAATGPQDDVYAEIRRLADADDQRASRSIAAAHRPKATYVAIPAAALGFVAGIAAVKLWRWLRHSRR